MKNKIIAVLLVAFSGSIPAFLIYLTAVSSKMEQFASQGDLKAAMLHTNKSGYLSYLSASIDFSYGFIWLSVIASLAGLVGLIAAAELWKMPGNKLAS